MHMSQNKNQTNKNASQMLDCSNVIGKCTFVSSASSPPLLLRTCRNEILLCLLLQRGLLQLISGISSSVLLLGQLGLGCGGIVGLRRFLSGVGGTAVSLDLRLLFFQASDLFLGLLDVLSDLH